MSDERHTIDLLAKASPSKQIAAASVDQLARVLTRFQHLADAKNCDAGAAVCTAAFRDAGNGRDVVKRLREITRYPVNILSARQEALYAITGARIGLRTKPGPQIMVDVGGGSTEIVRDANGRLQVRGINCGAARATKVWRDALPHRRSARAPFLREQAALTAKPLLKHSQDRVGHIIGVGGSIVTLAAIHLGLKEFDPRRVHGHVLRRKWLTETADRLAQLSQDEIAAIIPFDPRRARVLTAGTFLWSAVLDRYDADRVTVSVRGLRWGVAARLAGDMP